MSEALLTFLSVSPADGAVTGVVYLVACLVALYLFASNLT